MYVKVMNLITRSEKNDELRRMNAAIFAHCCF